MLHPSIIGLNNCHLLSNHQCLFLKTLTTQHYIFDLQIITYSIIGKWLYFRSIKGADKKIKGLYLYSVTFFIYDTERDLTKMG